MQFSSHFSVASNHSMMRHVVVVSPIHLQAQMCIIISIWYVHVCSCYAGFKRVLIIDCFQYLWVWISFHCQYVDLQKTDLGKQLKESAILGCSVASTSKTEKLYICLLIWYWNVEAIQSKAYRLTELRVEWVYWAD